MKVIPLTHTIWNLPVLRELVHKLTGKDLSTRAKDETEILIVLSKIKNQSTDEQKLIRESLLVQKHLPFCFAIICPWDTAVDWLQGMTVSTTVVESPKGVTLIASGNLQQWRDSLIINLQPTVSPNLRLVLKDILLHFETVGLGPVFDKYRKQSDGVLYLEEKR